MIILKYVIVGEKKVNKISFDNMTDALYYLVDVLYHLDNNEKVNFHLVGLEV